MDTTLIDEDSIDAEALQAQIDLSMSFAQSLVSSWMEPHRLPTGSRKRDLEKELSDYMKRPPRLGVGASIPEGHHNTTREVARLKGKLTGTGKRLHEDEDGASAPRRALDDEDEDESRAAAIKKKQKLDPFDTPHSKKKKKHHAKHDASEEGKPALPVVLSLPQNAQENVGKPDSLLKGTQSPSKIQKTSEQESISRNEYFPLLQDPALEEDSSTLTKCEQSLHLGATSPSRRLSESDGKSGPTPLTPNTTVVRNYEELLKRPLLNLTGPPASDDDESDAGAGATESPLTSPKKRRKRRKKKKHQPITESVCHSTSTFTAAPGTTLRDLQT